MEVFASDDMERELVQVLAETRTMDGELISSMNFIDKDHKRKSYIIMPAYIEQVLHHKLKNIQTSVYVDGLVLNFLSTHVMLTTLEKL